MMTWQHSVPSNQTTPTHQHDSQAEASPSDPPTLPEKETLEFQEEYPREEVEEVEVAEVAEVVEEEGAVSLPRHQDNKQPPIGKTNSLAIHHLYSQEIARNRRNS